jgi:hypothetical protein
MWAYVGAVLGGAVSVAANVAHSYVPPADAPYEWAPRDGAILGAVFWPVGMFIAIEILAKVGWPTGWRYAIVRFGGLLPVAVVAAVVSYRHLSGLLAFYGEDSLTIIIGPLAVDGLMVMATGALIATGRPTTTPRTSTPDTGPEQPAQPGDDAPLATSPARVMVPFTMWPGAVALPGPDVDDDADEDDDEAADDVADDATPAGRRRAATRARITRVRASHPDATQTEVARRAGCSARTVTRHWRATEPATTTDTGRVNGAPAPATTT